MLNIDRLNKSCELDIMICDMCFLWLFKLGRFGMGYWFI